MNRGQTATVFRKTFVSHSPEDLVHPADYIIKNSVHHKVIAFYGPMGAGKTTLIKTICRQLGTRDMLSSPTFGIVNEYRLTNGHPVYHIDFYRILSESEVFDLGYEQFFFSNHYCFIEWPEKIPNLLPPFCMKVYIVPEGNQRTLTIEHYD